MLRSHWTQSACQICVTRFSFAMLENCFSVFVQLCVHKLAAPGAWGWSYSQRFFASWPHGSIDCTSLSVVSFTTSCRSCVWMTAVFSGTSVLLWHRLRTWCPALVRTNIIKFKSFFIIVVIQKNIYIANYGLYCWLHPLMIRQVHDILCQSSDVWTLYCFNVWNVLPLNRRA